MSTDQLILPDEDDLMQKLQDGNQQSLSFIFNKFYPALCFFASGLISETQAAEEIVQDVFYKLWQKRADFNNLTSLKAFLYISTRNASLNYLDKKKRKHKRESNIYFMHTDVDQSVMNHMIYTEVVNEIRTEINKLPEQCGRIIKMLYEEEMRPQDIADALHIKVSTVYNQKMRGISILKRRLPAATFDLLMILLVLNGHQ